MLARDADRKQRDGAGVMARTCPSCSATDIVTDYSAGDVICRSCGLVIGDHVIDDQIEWRTFADGNPKCVLPPAHPAWNRCSTCIRWLAACVLRACAAQIAPHSHVPVRPCLLLVLTAEVTRTALAASTTLHLERPAWLPRSRGYVATLWRATAPPCGCIQHGTRLTCALVVPRAQVGDSGSGDSPLTRTHERLASNEERRVKAAFGRLSSLADVLGLPERVRGRSQQIYHDAVGKSKQLVRGKPAITAAAAVYAACRVERVPRSAKEVAAAACLKLKLIMQRFSALKRELDLDVTTVTVADFIVRGLVRRVWCVVGVPLPVGTSF